MDCSPPGSSVHGIFQAKIPEWVAVSYSRGSSRPGERTLVTCIGRQIHYREAQSLVLKVKKKKQLFLRNVDWDRALGTGVFWVLIPGWW